MRHIICLLLIVVVLTSCGGSKQVTVEGGKIPERVAETSSFGVSDWPQWGQNDSNDHCLSSRTFDTIDLGDQLPLAFNSHDLGAEIYGSPVYVKSALPTPEVYVSPGDGLLQKWVYNNGALVNAWVGGSALPLPPTAVEDINRSTPAVEVNGDWVYYVTSGAIRKCSKLTGGVAQSFGLVGNTIANATSLTSTNGFSPKQFVYVQSGSSIFGWCPDEPSLNAVSTLTSVSQYESQNYSLSLGGPFLTLVSRPTYVHYTDSFSLANTRLSIHNLYPTATPTWDWYGPFPDPWESDNLVDYYSTSSFPDYSYGRYNLSGSKSTLLVSSYGNDIIINASAVIKNGKFSSGPVMYSSTGGGAPGATFELAIVERSDDDKGYLVVYSWSQYGAINEVWRSEAFKDPYLIETYDEPGASTPSYDGQGRIYVCSSKRLFVYDPLYSTFPIYSSPELGQNITSSPALYENNVYVTANNDFGSIGGTKYGYLYDFYLP